MSLPNLYRAQVAVDCECGAPIEASDDDELLDELLEHIAATHETGLRRDAASLLVDAYDI